MIDNTQPYEQWRDEMLEDLRMFFTEHGVDPDQALAQLPSDLPRLIRHGHFSCVRDMVDKAVRSLEEALRIDPRSYEAHCTLGRIYMGHGKYAIAEQYYKSAIELKSDNFKDLLSWLYAMKRQGQCDELSQRLQAHIHTVMHHAMNLYAIESGKSESVFEVLEHEDATDVWLNAFSREAQEEFLTSKSIVLRDVLPPVVFSLIRAQQKAARENRMLTHDKARSRFVSFDLLSAAVLANFQLCDLVSKMVGKEVIPTYAFSIHYVAGGQIKPHRDRLQNELSMSLSLDMNPDGKEWPLYVGDEPDVRAVRLGLNDALLYRGAEVTQARKSLGKGRTCDQIIFGFRTVDESHCNCV